MLFRTISMWQCVIKHSRGVCSSLRIPGAKTGGTSEPSGVSARDPGALGPGSFDPPAGSGHGRSDYVADDAAVRSEHPAVRVHPG